MNLLSVTEAAARLGLDPRRVRQFCKEGRLGQRVGGRWVIFEDELEAFAAKPRPQGYPKGKPRK
jgi:excisionase family DNA binding protein